MRLLNLKSYLFLLLSFVASAQKTTKEIYTDYLSESREHVSVHLNKEVFKTKETLWFSAYLSTSQTYNELDESKILQIGLYNEQGMLVHKSLGHIEEGLASGSILLDYPPGRYFLKIQTNWMRNFVDSKPFITPIQIIPYGAKLLPLPKAVEIINKRLETSYASPDIKMIVNTMAPYDLIISFQKTNNKTAGINDFFLAFHNNETLEINPLKIIGETKLVKIAKDNLSQGIHTILLLDKNKEVLQERVIYHLSTFDNKKSLTLKLLNEENDSVQITLVQAKNVPAIARASVSIAPLQSQSIVNSMSLKVQNAFKNIWIPSEIKLFLPTNRASLAELNNRLAFAKNTLDWETLTTIRKDFPYPLEKGFSISGTVKNWDSTPIGNVSYYQQKSGDFEITDIKKDGSFVFEDKYLEKGKEINFSVLKYNKSISKPEITYHIFPKTFLDTLNIQYVTDSVQTKSDILKKKSETEQRRVTLESGIVLDDVELTATAKKEELTRNKMFAETIAYESIKVTSELTKKNPTLSSIIRRMGFIPRISEKNGRLFVLSTNPLEPPPVLIVDDIIESRGLINVPLTSIDEIYYEAVGIYGGKSGVIYIYRKNGLPVGKEKKGVVSYPVEEGYEQKQDYFNENISGKFDSFNIKYGAVYWDGDLVFDGDGITRITFPEYGLEGVKIIVQGEDIEGNYFLFNKQVIFD